MKRKLNAVNALIEYAVNKGLIEPMDRNWARNAVLDVLKLDAVPDGLDINAEADCAPELHEILDVLLDDAFQRGVIQENSVVYRDLLDTEIMGRLTPRPSETAAKFYRLYTNDGNSTGGSCDPAAATDWFYRFSQDTNYIRRDRMARDVRWKVGTEYGELDITINLSKPEKDPKAIAAAKNLPASDYPRCMLCAENEGYAGRLNYPARQNHRIIPVKVDGMDWFLQYSPYTYYNEHCIVFNSEHVPMKIDRACFRKLLSFVSQYPHYFVGSNADLPIVGGSILAHDHFQGGRYEFAMAKAPVEEEIHFKGFDDVKAGIVRWPMSVIRIASADPERLTELADKILTAWRGYTDESVFIFAETDGEPHNTITPIARWRADTTDGADIYAGNFEVDLVLRNNITTDEHPLGVFHPHAELHHIKKENIGLIEVMGLAVLPGRLKAELTRVAEILAGTPQGDVQRDSSARAGSADDALLTALRNDPLTEKHADWAFSLRDKYEFNSGNAWDIIREETGRVFARVLEDAGVYKRTSEGRAAFRRFIEYVNR
ncbi:MAG: UDP-glucose--hexose-1-phosphate uridylyltransferase [Eubacterium sp.]|nr:UDP-glucose--hexose-1-phosphate uridylyltransferase [Eubacterium sp.]